MTNHLLDNHRALTVQSMIYCMATLTRKLPLRLYLADDSNRIDRALSSNLEGSGAWCKRDESDLAVHADWGKSRWTSGREQGGADGAITFDDVCGWRLANEACDFRNGNGCDVDPCLEGEGMAVRWVTI